jgi:hypothetical protein
VLERDDYRPALTEDQANALTALAERVREVFTASSSGDVASAACIVNDLLEEFGAAPRLDPARGGGWTLYNLGKRFCSRRCQSRLKAAAHRAKSKG